MIQTQQQIQKCFKNKSAGGGQQVYSLFLSVFYRITYPIISLEKTGFIKRHRPLVWWQRGCLVTGDHQPSETERPGWRWLRGDSGGRVLILLCFHRFRVWGWWRLSPDPWAATAPLRKVSGQSLKMVRLYSSGALPGALQLGLGGRGCQPRSGAGSWWKTFGARGFFLEAGYGVRLPWVVSTSSG